MLIRADARARPLRDGCIDCVVTSPPYFGLRDYGAVGQIGIEPTPTAYVAAIVAVFRDVHRVMMPRGTVWLNLGDSYAGSGSGLKAKDLIGIPWRVAFALQADGWYLRADVIWSKPNPMPESVTDRPTKAHEYVFLLTKGERYFYDAAAIREEGSGRNWRESGGNMVGAGIHKYGGGYRDNGDGQSGEAYGRNKRSVWTVGTKPYLGAHFATFPEALVEPCILAGCPLGGLVLDPFVGSGTVVAVAERLGRRGVGVDLAYHDLSKARTAQMGLRW